jgi:predicted MFS family arabinose efflux permease
MEESAVWLACQGNLQEAAAVLRKTLDIDVVAAPDAKAARRNFSYGDLFKQPFLPRTVSCGAINFIQSLVYFSVLFYLPVVAGGLFGQNNIWALVGIGVIQFSGLFGSMASSSLANKVGLRWETIYGYAAEIVLLLVLGYFVKDLPPLVGAVLLGAFIFAHTFGPGQNGVSMAALSYPAELRGQGTGFSYGFGRLGSVAGFYAFPLVLAATGLGNTLMIIAAAPLVGLVVIGMIPWDPKGTETDHDNPVN